MLSYVENCVAFLIDKTRCCFWLIVTTSLVSIAGVSLGSSVTFSTNSYIILSGEELHSVNKSTSTWTFNFKTTATDGLIIWNGKVSCVCLCRYWCVRPSVCPSVRLSVIHMFLRILFPSFIYLLSVSLHCLSNGRTNH